jgi:hypothetical protein
MIAGRRRSTHRQGDAVEVQRRVDAPWEPATYVRSVTPGRHTVELDPESGPRYIDSRSGMEVDAYEGAPGVLRTRIVSVPTRRLRATHRILMRASQVGEGAPDSLVGCTCGWRPPGDGTDAEDATASHLSVGRMLRGEDERR